MIKVTVELISAISRDRDRLLGVATIANDGTGTGVYNYALSKMAPKERQAWKAGRAPTEGTLLGDTGEITGFDNVARGPWDLLYLVLKHAVGSRNRG